jgi:hypothetical protein
VKNRIYDDEELELYKDYIPIGGCAFGATLLLGIIDENRDKIFLEGSFLEGGISVVANNIFEFLKSFTVDVDEDIENIQDKLYLKLGQSVWSALEYPAGI